MDHWRLSLQRIQCGINFMSKIFIPTAKLAKAFHHRFCLPYTQYLKLLEDIGSNKLFNHWCGNKRNNKKVSPVDLLLLGLLRNLGRSWTFDDCEESTAIDQEVHRVFFVFSLFMAVLFCTKDGC